MLRIHWDATNAKIYDHHEDNCRGKEVFGKCDKQDPDHHINECELPNKCANCSGYHPVYAISCDSGRLEKKILAINHRSNIPYYEVQKVVVGSKTTAYSQAVQRGKIQHNKNRLWKY